MTFDEYIRDDQIHELEQQVQRLEVKLQDLELLAQDAEHAFNQAGVPTCFVGPYVDLTRMLEELRARHSTQVYELQESIDDLERERGRAETKLAAIRQVLDDN